jgi:hypothetical protein
MNAKDLITALTPLGATILGALGKLIAGASDSEALAIWATVEEEIHVTRIRLSNVRESWKNRDAANDARVAGEAPK